MCVLRDIRRETRFERSNRILAPELRDYVRRKVRHARIHTSRKSEREPSKRQRERERERSEERDRSRGNVYQMVIQSSVIIHRFLQCYYALYITWKNKIERLNWPMECDYNDRVAFILKNGWYDRSYAFVLLINSTYKICDTILI